MRVLDSDEQAAPAERNPTKVRDTYADVLSWRSFKTREIARRS